MMLPFWPADRLIQTKDNDLDMAVLADRHYSRRHRGRERYMLPGRKMVLRNTAGTILFGWLWQQERMDNQIGFNCAIFRNESARRSSDIILEAESLAFAKWGANRVFTYVNPRRIRSTNPGYCFQCAGWHKEGISKNGLILLAKSSSS